MQIDEIKDDIDWVEASLYILEQALAANPRPSKESKLLENRRYFLAKRIHLYEQLEAKVYYSSLAPPPNAAGG